MNNIFKVIWNHATQTWTAVGELASAKGKSKSVKLAAISTALLVAATGVEAANVVSKADERGQLSIATDKVTNQFFGNARYKAETGLTKNVPGATVNAYDGIAIGNGAVSGAAGSTTGGNAHVAIGLMAHASGGGANGDNAAVALGAYSLATGQGGTAIGAHSVADALNSTALGKVAKANGDGSTAVGTSTRAEWQGTALGNTAEALGFYATSIGVNSKANSHSSTSIGKAAVVSGKNAIGVGTETKVNGEGTVAVGSGTNVSSKNVSTLGSNITVAAGRDGAVVLGHESSADDKVIAVHSAKIGDNSKLTYSGFAGDLGGTNNKGKNQPAASDKQGNFVSVGSEDNERQIKHVAAGRITENSTDALNGSQLYSVAKTLGNAAEGLADTLGVDLNEDGTVKNKFSQPLTVAEGSNYAKPADAGDVKTALTNLNNYVNAGWNITASGNDYKNNVSVGHTVNFVGLGNVDVDGVNEENGVRTINISSDSPIDYATTKAEVDGKEVDVVKANDGKWYPKDKVDEDNNPKEGAAPIPSSEILKKGAKLTDSDTENNPYEKGNSYTYDDKGNITATGYDKTKPESKDEITAGKNGVQLNNVGWATQPDQAVNKDQLDQTVNKSGFFVKNNGEDVATKDSDNKAISPKDKVTPNDVINFANGDGTVVNVKTVRDDKGVDTTTVSVDVDAAKVIDKVKGNVTAAKVDGDDAGKVTVEEADKGKLATVDTVKDAINSSFWTARVENNDKQVVKTADNSANATIKAGSNVAFVAGKNLVANQTTTGDNTVFTYGLASEIEVDKITVKAKAGEADKGTTVENGKVTNLNDHLTAPEKVAADKAKVANATVVSSAPISGNGNEAATVNDVLNAGWNLKTNGNQTAAITNGKGLDFASDDNSVTITPTVDKDGNAKVNFSVNATSVINNNKGSIKEASTDPKAANAGKVTVSDADKGKLATVDTVAEAINSAATFVKVADSQEVIEASTANDKGVAVKSGDTVTHTAGKNLKVKRDGQSVTYALAQDIDVNSVKATNGVTIGSGDNATTITSNDKGLNLAGKDGAATNINNVKDAELNSTSKQAVNGSQLYATNKKVAGLEGTVNNLSNVINHHAGAIDSLDRKVNKHSKQARAGIAGANAAAALPQAYTQGKAMVAAAAGTFKGQNALAVGYSRISDNGKVILKLQGNANTSGDVGAGVGVGYQW
ncbi:YadA-like family protein [Haemophilus influenzae]|uniref:YadA-like family protein n=1 Tax=Haemophilus influenzae TaxID=727 RepID=UPI000668ACC1|nr:YadA-like family protein [Haemophilus influenzae]